MTDTWEIHRTLYAARETTWRLTPEEKAADWDGKCGWCGKPLQAHEVLARVDTTDALLARPYEPVSPLVADRILGRLTEAQIAGLDHASRLALAVLDPDSKELPA